MDNQYSIILRMKPPCKCFMEIYDDKKGQIIDTTLDATMNLDSALNEAKNVLESHYSKIAFTDKK